MSQPKQLNLILHPRVVGSAHAQNYCVLQLTRALQFRFMLEQRDWFESLKIAKSRKGVISSLPGEGGSKAAFLAALIEKEVLQETTDREEGEISPWGSERLPELESMGQPFTTVRPQEWQLDFAFADAAISAMVC